MWDASISFCGALKEEVSERRGVESALVREVFHFLERGDNWGENHLTFGNSQRIISLMRIERLTFRLYDVLNGMYKQ